MEAPPEITVAALDALLAVGGWRGWLLDAETCIVAWLGRWEEPGPRRRGRWRGRRLEAVMGEEGPVVRALLARLSLEPAVRVLAGPDGGFDGQGVRVGDHRVVAVRWSGDRGRRNSRAGLVRSVVEAASAGSGVAEVLLAAARGLAGELGDRVIALVRRPEGLVAVGPEPLPLALGRPLPVGSNVAWEAVETGRPLIVDDIEGDPRLRLDRVGERLRRLGPGALALWPLGEACPALGALLVVRAGVRFPAADLDLLQRVAEALRRGVERACVHDRLRSQHDFLQQVLGATSDGVVVSTLTGTVLLWNRRMEEITGLRRAEVRHAWAEQVGLRRVGAEAGVASEPALEEGEWELIASDGTPRRVAIHRVDLVGEEGERTVLEFVRDLTDAVRAREAALRARNLAGLARLAGGLSHQFNNLLGTCLGHACLLEEREDLPPEVRAVAREIAVEVRRGADLARRLMAFGSDSSPEGTVDVASTVRGEVEEHAASMPALRWEGADAALHVHGEERRLRLVLQNLLQNAREAAGSEGGVRVEVSSPDTLPGEPMQLQPEPQDRGWVRIAVVDDGPGFPARAMRHLFEPFFSTKGWNHGLGLAAVHGIVSRWGGGIRVRNLPAGGASVEVWLPRAEPPPEPRAPAASPPAVGAAEGRPSRVWVVDDEGALLELMAHALARRGFTVTSFTTAEEVLDRVGAGEPLPDALVLDVILPGLSGPELARRLRSSTPGVPPVVFVSGYTPAAVALRVEPPDGFLQKPFTPSALAATLAGVLEAVGRRPPSG